MRVLFVCDGFFRYTVPQAVALSRTGAEVRIACRAQTWEFGGSLSDRAEVHALARDAGVKVYELPPTLRDLGSLGTIASIRHDLAQWPPDIVHVHDGAEPRLLMATPRAATALTVHDPVLHPGHPVPRSRLTRAALDFGRRSWRSRAEVVFVHSERLRQEFARHQPGARVVVIPHGLSPSSEPALPPHVRAVGFFGRMEPYKGIDVLERAMKFVWTQRPDVRLIVAGQGPTELSLTDARLDRVAHHVHERDVTSLLRRMSLVVLPYTQASQSGVASLAVAQGIPVVVSDVGGLPDLALDPSYIVPPGDVDRLAAAILAHVDDSVDVRHRVLRQRATPLSWDTLALRTLPVYHALISER